MTTASKDRNFKNYAKSQEDEDAYDYVKFREGIKPTSFLGAFAHLIKSALGGGILGGPVAYMKGGVAVAIPINIIGGIYIGYCLHLLVQSTQKLMRRSRTPFLSYADAGEAAFMLFPKPNVAKYAKCFRYFIDFIICLDLFGSCCTYQIIVAKSVKQLVENVHVTSIYGPPGYPSLRLYILILVPIFILLCLITQLKFLVPFTLAANGVIVMAIFVIIYYCFQYNPNFEDLKTATDFEGALTYIGMAGFSMSCAGVVIPVENNMKEPQKFSRALVCGQIFIIFAIFNTSFFGYAAFLEDTQAPFTINFPMEVMPKIFKVAICLMVFVTHALNFWVPFNLCWYYIKKRFSEHRILMWERFFRTIFVILIAIVAIIFPSIVSLMGFLGCFCITNMAVIWPNIITILVLYERPGWGRYKWRLWRGLIFIAIGLFIMVCGSIVTIKSLGTIFTSSDVI